MFEDKTATALLEQCLAQIPDTIDKRKGSIIYDALMPACTRLSEEYSELENIYEETNPETTSGEYLDGYAKYEGVVRYPGSPSVRVGLFRDDSDNLVEDINDIAGTTWAQIDNDEVEFEIPEEATQEEFYLGEGKWKLICTEIGFIGSSVPEGELSETMGNSDLEGYLLDTILNMGSEEEDDESLRDRYLIAMQKQSFGGNIPDYKEKCKAIEDLDGQQFVQGVQVYPTPNGVGGEVGLAFIGIFNDIPYSVPTDTASWLAYLHWKIDPVNISSDEEALLMSTFNLSQKDIKREIGFAPISHKIYVKMPTTKNVVVRINVDNIIFADGETLSDTKREQIKLAVGNYLDTINADWDKGGVFNDEQFKYELIIYYAQIVTAIVNTGEIELAEEENNLKIAFEGDTPLEQDLVLPQKWVNDDVELTIVGGYDIIVS